MPRSFDGWIMSDCAARLHTKPRIKPPVQFGGRDRPRRASLCTDNLRQRAWACSQSYTYTAELCMCLFVCLSKGPAPAAATALSHAASLLGIPQCAMAYSAYGVAALQLHVRFRHSVCAHISGSLQLYGSQLHADARAWYQMKDGHARTTCTCPASPLACTCTCTVVSAVTAHEIATRSRPDRRPL